MGGIPEFAYVMETLLLSQIPDFSCVRETLLLCNLFVQCLSFISDILLLCNVILLCFLYRRSFNFILFHVLKSIYGSIITIPTGVLILSIVLII